MISLQFLMEMMIEIVNVDFTQKILELNEKMILVNLIKKMKYHHQKR